MESPIITASISKTELCLIKYLKGLISLGSKFIFVDHKNNQDVSTTSLMLDGEDLQYLRLDFDKVLSSSPFTSETSRKKKKKKKKKKNKSTAPTTTETTETKEDEVKKDQKEQEKEDRDTLILNINEEIQKEIKHVMEQLLKCQEQTSFYYCKVGETLIISIHQLISCLSSLSLLCSDEDTTTNMTDLINNHQNDNRKSLPKQHSIDRVLLNIENAITEIRSSCQEFLKISSILNQKLNWFRYKIITLPNNNTVQYHLQAHEQHEKFKLLGKSITLKILSEIVGYNRKIVKVLFSSALSTSCFLYSSFDQRGGIGGRREKEQITTLIQQYETCIASLSCKYDTKKTFFFLNYLPNIYDHLQKEEKSRMYEEKATTVAKREENIGSEVMDNPYHENQRTSCADLTDEIRETENVRKEDMNNLIGDPNNLMEDIRTFFFDDNACSNSSSNIVILHGPSGSGKTFTCQSIYNYIQYLNNNMSNGDQRVSIIYPKLPKDLLLATKTKEQKVGSMEKNLIQCFLSAFSPCSSNPQNEDKKSILILDGLHYILGQSYNKTPREKSQKQQQQGGQNEIDELTSSLASNTKTVASDEIDDNSQPLLSLSSQSLIRLRATFQSLLSLILSQSNNILLICTCKSVPPNDLFSSSFSHKTKQYAFSNIPDSQKREEIIASCLQLHSITQQTSSFSVFKDDDTNNNNGDYSYDKKQPLASRHQIVLDRIVNHALGKSISEIILYCREAIISTHKKNSTVNNKNDEKLTEQPNSSPTHYKNYHIWSLLKSMESIVSIPQTSSSLTDSSYLRLLDGVADLHVYTTPQEIFPTFKSGDEIPLIGKDANRAWKQLKSLIITPLCQYQQLDDLLFDKYDPNCQINTNNTNSSSSKIVCAGALLTGLPGSGKSSLARHCAATALSVSPKTKFLDVSCTSLIHKQVGESERAIQKLFQSAKMAAPCILLLDGIENIAPHRGYDNTTEGTMDRVVSTLLTQLDGFNSLSDNTGKIAVIGITYDPNLIDPAIRRPGRLEKCIQLNFPDSIARTQIFRKELEKLPIELLPSSSPTKQQSTFSFNIPKNKDALADFLSFSTPNYSATQIQSVCSEAAMCCLREFLSLKVEKEKSSNNSIKGKESKSFITTHNVKTQKNLFSERIDFDKMTRPTTSQQMKIRYSHFVTALDFIKTGSL